MYAYVGNDPVNMVDPTGEAWSWATAGIGALAGAVGGAVSSIVEQSYNDGPISWGQVAGDSFAGATGGFIAGVLVGAITGDPTAAVAALTIAGAGVGGAVSGQINAVTNVLTETDLSEPQFQGRYPVGELESREQVEEAVQDENRETEPNE